MGFRDYITEDVNVAMESLHDSLGQILRRLTTMKGFGPDNKFKSDMDKFVTKSRNDITEMRKELEKLQDYSKKT